MKITKTIFCLIAMFFLVLSLTACEEPHTRFNDVLNYHSNQVESIHFGSETVSKTDTNPRFRIMLSWLQENQDHFSSRSTRRHEQNYLKIADEIIYFYGSDRLFTNFLDYYLELLLQTSTADIQWQFLTGLSVNEIIIEGIGQDFSFSSRNYDLNFILDFLEANQEQLYFEWDFDDSPAHSIEIILNNPNSHLNQNFIFTNSVARLSIGEAFHDQLWSILEVKFGVVRDGSFSPNSRVSFVLNNRADEITMLDFAQNFGDWRRAFHRNHSGDHFEIVLSWLIENQEFLYDDTFRGAFGKTIYLDNERIHFYIEYSTMVRFWSFLDEATASVDGTRLTATDWEYLAQHYELYINTMWISGSNSNLTMSRRNYHSIIRFFAENRDLILRDAPTAVAMGEMIPISYHVSISFRSSTERIGDQFLNRTMFFQISESTYELLVEAIRSKENFTTKHPVRDITNSQNIDVSYEDWRYLATNFRHYIGFMNAGRTWARSFPFDNNDNLSLLLNFFAENYTSLYNHTLVNASNLPVVYIAFFGTNSDSRFYNVHWQFHLSHELYDELEDIINANFRFGGWID